MPMIRYVKVTAQVEAETTIDDNNYHEAVRHMQDMLEAAIQRSREVNPRQRLKIRTITVHDQR